MGSGDPALEAQAPYWEPGTAHGYHAITYGHLVGEVVRRIDGRSLGTFFHDEFAEPLGLEFWIGLPEEFDARVAPMICDEPRGWSEHRGSARRRLDDGPSAHPQRRVVRW